MNITAAMKRFARAKGWITDASSDDDIRKALSSKLVAGDITTEAWALLVKDQDPDPRSILTQLVDDRLSGFETRIRGLLTEAGVFNRNQGGQQGDQGSSTATATPTTAPPAQGGSGTTDFDAAIQRSVSGVLARYGLPAPDSPDERVSPTQLLSRSAQASYLGSGNVRVKTVVEKFNRDRAEARWDGNSKHVNLRGKRVTFPSETGPGMGRPMSLPSEADKAIIGSWLKWTLYCGGHAAELPTRYRMTDLDWDLMKYALHELPWTGTVGGTGDDDNATGIDGQKLTDVMHRGQPCLKALLDDSVSGGINAAPQVVEDAIILVPLLYGELFPEVTVTNLARGRRITMPTMGTPTFTSGTPEGTPIPLFDTTNFIGALDTTIFNAVGAMEIGLDFEEDSPADLGALVIARYGEAALQWLDRVIAVGDGVVEPTGIFNTAGVTTVAAANGAAGPLTVADSEALMFGVNKAYRTSRGGRNVFVGNEVNYRRFRQIPTATGANDRVFGDQYGDYQVLGTNFKIIPQVPNNKLAYTNIAFYHMWRRLGMQVKVETAGKELSLKNLKLIVVRLRYGGRLELGGSTAIIVDAPA